nr:ABC transporter permease [Salsipaludibacter albus]
MPFILRRVLIGIVTLLVASFVLFAAITILPGDEVRALFGFGAVDTEQYRLIVERLHYDRPFLVQYWLFLQDFVVGDFGLTLQGAPIGPIIRSRIAPSLWILLGVTLIQLVLGPLLLWLSVRRPRTPLERVSSTATIILVSVPTLVAAFVLQAVMVYWTDLLPSPKWIYPPSELAGWRNYVMPILALGVGTAAHLAMVGRVELLATLSQPYITTARGLGIPRDRILKVEAMRPTAGRVVQLVAANTAVLLTGLIVVEDVFQVPGLGSALLEAIQGQDRLLVITMLMFVLAGVLVVNTVADILHGWIDPRVRAEDF